MTDTEDEGASQIPDADDVPEITEAQMRRLQAELLGTEREGLLPEGEVTECPVCGGEMESTEDLEKTIPTPRGLTVVTRLSGARCTQCKTRQFDPAAIALIMKHSSQEIVADYETSVTKASGNTLGTYFKKDLSRVLGLTGDEHLRWTVLDEDRALVEIHREEADAEA